MTIVAKTLYEAAVRSHKAEKAKWHQSSETNALLSACEEASGISHWILCTAMGETIANSLLNDLYDICSRDLRQNSTAYRFYARDNRTDRYGNAEEVTSRLTVSSPMHEIVTRYLDNLYYQRTECASDWRAKQAQFLRYFDSQFSRVEAVYSAECVRQLREYIDRNLAETKGGVA